MKIYNRRNFAAGILSLLLAAACGVVLLATGFAAKWLIALVILLAAGGFDLWWSLSRDSRLPRVDERDEAVSRKSAWLAYRIVANGCWAAGIAALVIYGISRMPAALASSSRYSTPSSEKLLPTARMRTTSRGCCWAVRVGGQQTIR